MALDASFAISRARALFVFDWGGKLPFSTLTQMPTGAVRVAAVLTSAEVPQVPSYASATPPVRQLTTPKDEAFYYVATAGASLAAAAAAES